MVREQEGKGKRGTVTGSNGGTGVGGYRGKTGGEAGPGKVKL